LQSFDRAGAKELGPTRANFFLFFSGAVDDFRLFQTLGPAPLKKQKCGFWAVGCYKQETPSGVKKHYHLRNFDFVAELLSHWGWRGEEVSSLWSPESPVKPVGEKGSVRIGGVWNY
jgi:hypothetical protein